MIFSLEPQGGVWWHGIRMDVLCRHRMGWPVGALTSRPGNFKLMRKPSASAARHIRDFPN